MKASVQKCSFCIHDKGPNQFISPGSFLRRTHPTFIRNRGDQVDFSTYKRRMPCPSEQKKYSRSELSDRICLPGNRTCYLLAGKRCAARTRLSALEERQSAKARSGIPIHSMGPGNKDRGNANSRSRPTAARQRARA